ncbi:unnamed protein product [Acanthoscelides obtectus]|uniref:Uncharacterized protein n=1 Tax=Acanthoscelides obtectus TaxID=200917 RepID=A0A9P0K2Z0_ACAOB|nr:unnamed protein product [Acanthoscelides obtectus]CAK1620251.1 hypothetical protein AOBTE_LOCUS260 [Acanthoscelides obtectus]
MQSLPSTDQNAEGVIMVQKDAKELQGDIQDTVENVVYVSRHVRFLHYEPLNNKLPLGNKEAAEEFVEVINSGTEMSPLLKNTPNLQFENCHLEKHDQELEQSRQVTDKLMECQSLFKNLCADLKKTKKNQPMIVPGDIQDTVENVVYVSRHVRFLHYQPLNNKLPLGNKEAVEEVVEVINSGTEMSPLLKNSPNLQFENCHLEKHDQELEQSRQVTDELVECQSRFQKFCADLRKTKNQPMIVPDPAPREMTTSSINSSELEFCGDIQDTVENVVYVSRHVRFLHYQPLNNKLPLGNKEAVEEFVEVINSGTEMSPLLKNSPNLQFENCHLEKHDQELEQSRQVTDELMECQSRFQKFCADLRKTKNQPMIVPDPAPREMTTSSINSSELEFCGDNLPSSSPLI